MIESLIDLAITGISVIPRQGINQRNPLIPSDYEILIGVARPKR